MLCITFDGLVRWAPNQTVSSVVCTSGSEILAALQILESTVRTQRQLLDADKLNISVSAFAPEKFVSRDWFDNLVSRHPAHLITQAESGAYLRNSSRVPCVFSVDG